MIFLQAANVVFSIVSIYYWFQVGRVNPSLRTPVLWPIALLVSNALFSSAVIVDTFVVDFITPTLINYWGQGVRIQLAVTLFVGARYMYPAFRKNGKKK